MIQLSILTPAVPSRLLHQLDHLCDKIGRQIGDLPVEHLVLIDNKRRTVGEKRDALLRVSRGRYVAFVDDDDDIASEYVSEILRAIQSDPDVVTFQQKATVNGESAIIEFKLGNPNEPFKGISQEATERTEEKSLLSPLSPVKRSAWHVCAWRRSLAVRSTFPSTNYGEDWAFVAPLIRMAKSEEHIPKILHYYRHSSTTTEAPAPTLNQTRVEWDTGFTRHYYRHDAQLTEAPPPIGGSGLV